MGIFYKTHYSKEVDQNNWLLHKYHFVKSYSPNRFKPALTSTCWAKLAEPIF